MALWFRNEEQKDMIETGLEYELYSTLRQTRQESGMTIEQVAGVIKDAFAWEEQQALIKELNG